MADMLLTKEGPVDARVVAWRYGGVVRATVVVKATFAFSDEGETMLVEPFAVVTDEPSAPGAPPRDDAPWLERPQVVVVRAIVSGTEARLTVARDGAVLLDVAHDGDPATLAAAFGALVADASLRGLDRDASIVDVPEGLATAVFQCAPVERRVAALEPGTTVRLQGLAAVAPVVTFAIPDLPLVVEAAVGPGARAIPVRLDTLLIDGDRGRCSMVWRGDLPVHAESDLAAVRCSVRLAVKARPATMPFRAIAGPAPGLAVDLHRGASDYGSGTLTLPDRIPRAAVTPFAGASAGEPPIARAGQTADLSRDALRRAAAAAAVPFGPGDTSAPARPAAPLAGAPWSTEDAPRVRAPLPGSATVSMPFVARGGGEEPSSAGPGAPAAAPPVGEPSPPPAPSPAPTARRPARRPAPSGAERAGAFKAQPWVEGGAGLAGPAPKPRRHLTPRKNLNDLLYDEE